MSSTAPTEGPGAATSDDVIDAHVHVWDAARADYPWMAEAPGLARRYDLADVEAEHALAGVRQVVLVQAADNVEDTENMLRTAQSRPHSVAGVVAWVPLRDTAGSAALLDRWAGAPVVGVRHLLHRDPEPDLLLAPAVDETLGLVAERGLTFDVCAETVHLLRLVPALAERHPDLTLVVDHLAKPPIRDGGWEPWASALAHAAQAPNVVAKLSGLNTAADPAATSADFSPYVDHALDLFGPQRIMYGGDWPFALLAADSYMAIWEPLRRCLDSLDDGARHEVLAGTARRTYGLTDHARRHGQAR